METSHKLTIVKKLYLYLVSFATLMMIVISGSTIISTVLKMTILTQADNYWSTPYVPGCEGSIEATGNLGQAPVSPVVPVSSTTSEYCKQQVEQNKKQQEQNRIAMQQSSLVWSISLLIIAIPLFILHWRAARKES